MPEVDRFDVLASHPDKDGLDSVPWRDALYTNEEEPQLAGEVSSGDDYYNIIQYGDILEAVAQGIEGRPEDIQPEGHVALSDTRHKMSARIGMDQSVEARPGDEINLDLRARSGHSGYHGLKFDVGAMREICSNGMMAFVADQSYEQTHSEEFQPQLAYHAVDAVMDGVDTVEQRLEQAQERTLRNQDEALLVLQDVGIDRYLEQPTADLLTALNEEVEDPEEPSLYETFNAATYALTHLSEDRPQYQLDDGYEQASQLLEYGEGIPHPDILGENAVRRRANELIEDPDAEEHYEGETEDIRELMEYHEVQA
jgi:hypothetical protein